jgi:hypothetical protein
MPGARSWTVGLERSWEYVYDNPGRVKLTRWPGAKIGRTMHAEGRATRR